MCRVLEVCFQGICLPDCTVDGQMFGQRPDDVDLNPILEYFCVTFVLHDVSICTEWQVPRCGHENKGTGCYR